MGNMISDLAEGASKGLFSGIGNMAVSIRQAIKGVELDPNKAAEIDKQLAEIEERAKELDVKFSQITAEDRDSARKRETAIITNGKKIWTMPILAGLAIIGMFALGYFTFTHDIRERELAFMIVGFAIAIVKDIYGYYFGSSSGSAEKSDSMTEILRTFKK